MIIGRLGRGESVAPASVKRKFNIFFWSRESALPQNWHSKKGFESEGFFHAGPETVKKNWNPLTFNSLKNPWAALALPAKVFVRSRHRRGGHKPI
jgi:hypothetical protein